jgi:hypothetical protein
MRVTPHVERRQLAAFAILAGARVRLPASVQHVLRRPVFGINEKLARRIPVHIRGSSYWLLPGRKHLCIVSLESGSQTVGTICETTATAIRHGIATVGISARSLPHRKRTIVGVVPNNIKEVLVRTDGATSTATLRHEIFTLEDVLLEPPEDIMLLRRGDH